MTPASIRNNNPGAIEPGYASKKFGATRHEVLRWKGPDGNPRENRIATFPTPQHGAAAQMHLLATGRHYRNKPIRQAVQTWCGGYWSDSYERVIKAKAGISPETCVTVELLSDVEFAIGLCKAMAWQEAGRAFPMDDAGWRTAHQMAFGSGYAPAPHPDNDVPFPKPEAAAREATAAAAKVTTAVTAVGGAATAISQTPTEAITKATETITSAKGLGEAVAGATTFAAGAPFAVAAALACGAVVLLWPKIKERWL